MTIKPAPVISLTRMPLTRVVLDYRDEIVTSTDVRFVISAPFVEVFRLVAGNRTFSAGDWA